MSEELYRETFNITGGDFNNAGSISTKIKSTLIELGIDKLIVRRTVIATFEAEMNVVMYADVGKISLILNQDHINILVEDKGKGIENIDMAMQPGFSTATDEMREKGFGAGMGLPNIKRNADIFSINSTVDVGTILDLKFSLETI